MLICRSCGRKIDAVEVKYRATIDGASVTICPDCAKQRGI
jgi:ribosome-binding protein aMBF1 (putative translation factor)